jgi:hypothetical protein
MAEKLKRDSFSMKELKNKFEVAASFIETDESLKAILKQIVKERITDTTVMNRMIQGTDWYKKYTNDYRNYMYVKETNPAVFAKNLAQQKQAVLKQAQTLGVEIDDATAEKWADLTLRGNSKVNKDGSITLYDEAWLAKKMAAAIDFSKTKTVGGVTVPDLFGSVADAAEQLYKTAREFGIDTTMSNNSFQNWMKTTVGGLVSGDFNSSDVEDDMREMAANNFPAFADQIRKGYTLREVAAPQINAIARELELDEGTFDLNDNLVQQVLNGQEKPMTAYEARKAARKDTRWKFTENAKNEYKNIGSKILADFGFGG